jgi:hypothetical protein
MGSLVVGSVYRCDLRCFTTTTLLLCLLSAVVGALLDPVLLLLFFAPIRPSLAIFGEQTLSIRLVVVARVFPFADPAPG